MSDPRAEHVARCNALYEEIRDKVEELERTTAEFEGEEFEGMIGDMVILFSKQFIDEDNEVDHDINYVTTPGTSFHAALGMVTILNSIFKRIASESDDDE